MPTTSLGNFGEKLTQTYNSSSGCDIVATIDGILIGNLNGISFSTTREKAPIYVLGSTDAVAFGRGKRGHAGSLIFTNFDRHALYDIMENTQKQGDQKRYYYFKKSTDVPAGGRSMLLNQDVDQALANLGVELARANYPDQIPPFTITLSMMNEYGNMSVMHILGVELINEGSGISIDDIVTETQMTFVARAIIGWTPVGHAGALGLESLTFDSANYNVADRLNNLAVVRQAETAASL